MTCALMRMRWKPFTTTKGPIRVGVQVRDSEDAYLCT